VVIVRKILSGRLTVVIVRKTLSGRFYCDNSEKDTIR